MKRIAILIAVVMIFPVSTLASKLERSLKSRWLGAWVVTTVETYSNCNGYYTANRMNGRLVNSRGGHRFERGELAKVVRVDAKRRRVDLLLSLPEPLLVPYNDGRCWCRTTTAPLHFMKKSPARWSWRSRFRARW